MSQPRTKPPSIIQTSDVTRPRLLGLTALGGALGGALALVVAGRPLAEARPIARAHRDVACASCHSESMTTTSAPPHHMAGGCVTCHGGHTSTRSAHQSLAARGELSCGTCHSQHARPQGITFDDAAIVRWGAGSATPVDVSKKLPGARGIRPGTTVPLVSLAACTTCHDPTRPADPIAACVPAGAAAPLATVSSGCFDEHVRLGDLGSDARRSRAACANQHTPTRFVAWDAARAIANTTAWVAPSPASTSARVALGPAAGGLAGAVMAMAGAELLERRRRRPAEPRATPAPSPRKRLPVIDPSTCLGCYACVDACPFDVLAIERYVAVVARPEECCGVILCEQVCPNGSLRVADGPVVLDRPATDAHLESVDVPGVYLAGDLTGLPLIKNAIQQGVRAVDRIAETSSPRRRDGTIDVVVIGAGPAGLSAALRAKEKGLSCVVLEQATVAASIKSFPRDKIVHDPPLDLPVEGELWLKESTKEELLSQWSRIVRARRLDVREGHRVVDMVRTERGFAVVAEVDGARRELSAARVVLAMGRRGTPRKLDLECEPGTEERVGYGLADARSFEGKRVIVVGLGDAAMESAIALARQPRTEVTVSYRGTRFVRGKKKNIDEIERLVREGKVKILFETVPVAITKSGVTLIGTGAQRSRRTVNADAMLVLIGGTPAWELLVRVGIKRPG